MISEPSKRGSLIINANLEFSKWVQFFRSDADRSFSRPGYTPSTHPQHERRTLPPQGEQDTLTQGGSVLDGRVHQSSDEREWITSRRPVDRIYVDYRTAPLDEPYLRVKEREPEFCHGITHLPVCIGHPKIYTRSIVALRGSTQQHGRIQTMRTPLARCGPTFTKVAKTVVVPPRPNGPNQQR